MVVAVAAGVLVAWASGDRLPGDSSSGDIAQNVTAKLAEARSLQASDLKGAIQRYDEVLAGRAGQPRGPHLPGLAGGAGGLAGQRHRPRAEGRAVAAAGHAGGADLRRPFCFEAIVRFRMFADAAGAPARRCSSASP